MDRWERNEIEEIVTEVVSSHTFALARRMIAEINGMRRGTILGQWLQNLLLAYIAYCVS